jgi:hypothetical protein
MPELVYANLDEAFAVKPMKKFRICFKAGDSNFFIIYRSLILLSLWLTQNWLPKLFG